MTRPRSKTHLDFVRNHCCLVSGCYSESVQAHHVGDTATAAMSKKPGDQWTVPLCNLHHNGLHNFGRKTFEELHRLDLRKAARWLAKRSPCRKIQKVAGEND